MPNINLPEIRDAAGQLFEATGEYRKPKPSEWYLGDNMKPLRATVNDELYLDSIILRPAWWSWPSWLKGWGIAMDRGLNDQLFSGPARISGNGWVLIGGDVTPLAVVRRIAIDFRPPVIADWRVPVLNPNYKAE